MPQITTEKAKEIMEAIADVKRDHNYLKNKIDSYERVLTPEKAQSILLDFEALEKKVAAISSIEEKVDIHIKRVENDLWSDNGLVKLVNKMFVKFEIFMKGGAWIGGTITTLLVLISVVIFTTAYNNKYGYHERQTKDTVQVIHYVPYFTHKLDPEGENGDDK